MGGHHPTCHVKPDSTLFLLLTALPDSMQPMEALLGCISKMFITQWADNISSISSLFYQSIIYYYFIIYLYMKPDSPTFVAYSISRLHAASGSSAGGGGVS